MPYLGVAPNPRENREVDDISGSFNGSTTAFTLQSGGSNVSPGKDTAIIVSLGGVVQNPGTDYTIAASTITFTTAPASGLSFFGVVLAQSIDIETVADNTVTTAKIVNDAVTADKLAHTSVTAGSYTTADITVDAQGRITAAASGTISGAEIADQAVTNAKVNNSAAIAVSKLANFVTNNADNRVITGSGTTNTLNGEANLTFDGDTAAITRSGNSAGGLSITNTNNTQASAHARLELSGGDNASAIMRMECNGHSNEFIADGSGNLRIDDNGTERMRIDSSGNVGIGTSSPASYDSSVDDLVIQGSGNTGITIATTNTGSNTSLVFADGTGDADSKFRGGVQYIHNGDIMRFLVSSAEKVRIDSSGMVSIGSTSGSLGGEKLFVKNGGASANVAGFFFNNTQDRTNVVIKHDRATGGTNAIMIDFINQTNGSVGSITSHGSSTGYNTSSDYRLKENAVAISDGITRLKTLKPYRFNFKVDPTTIVDGFFAHEVTAVPEAITGVKDAMQPLTFYEEGDTLPSGKKVGDAKTFSETEIKPQTIDHSKLVPLLTAALQEAIAKVEVLETKVAALEAA